MKSFKNPKMKFLIIALTISSLSCASSQKLLSKPLELRTLRINPDLSGFKYCTRSRSSIFDSWKQKCDLYPFTDKVMMKTLLDKGFVLKVRVKP